MMMMAIIVGIQVLAYAVVVPSFADIAKKASPAVVFIQVEKGSARSTPSHYWNDPFLNQFFFGDPSGSGRYSQPKTGQGSGFFIDPSGYILTNNHVVENARRIVVRLSTNREFEAELIGADPQSDVALIKIHHPDPFPYVPMGDSDALAVGDWVLAIGNPFGLSNTLTAGIVSAKGRNHMGITDYENFIQTDAAINPGNSGGPLVNMAGEVVGINTAIFSQSGGSMGIGFSIPMTMARPIMEQLKAYGRFTRGYLGVMIQDIDPDLAAGLGVIEQGVMVVNITPNSPADTAGIQRRDIITHIDDEAVNRVVDFRNRVALTKPDTSVDLRIRRNNRDMVVPVVIGQLDGPVYVTEAPQKAPVSYGIGVKPISDADRSRLQLPRIQGVIIDTISPGSPASQAGIPVNGIITEVNQVPIGSMTDFKRVTAKKTSPLIVLVYYQGAFRYYVLQ